jgi:hypothetical protein
MIVAPVLLLETCALRLMLLLMRAMAPLAALAMARERLSIHEAGCNYFYSRRWKE